MSTLTKLLLALFLLSSSGYAFAQTQDDVLPSPSQVLWADQEIGVIIHLDINVFTPDEFDYDKRETLPPTSVFHPSKLNTDQWVRAAKSAGAKYAVLVAKHGTGFSLWPTKQHGYHVGNTPWKNGLGDVVADFIKSCKKYNIRPGIYCSTGNNTYYGVRNNIFHSPDSLAAYNEMVLGQLTELWSNYGKLFEIWFDGGIMPSSKGGISDEVADLIGKYQPDALLFQGPASRKNLIRWVGNENGKAPYPLWSRSDTTTSSNGMVEIKDLQGDPDGRIWCPAESDFPNRQKSAWEGGWLWKANEEEKVLPADELVRLYYSTVGNNSNMLLGMAIDTSGSFPQKDEAIFAAFGKEVKSMFSKSIAETSGSGNQVVLNLPHPGTVNHVMLMEDITKGENIREYSVEAMVNGTWQTMASGSSVGHKRIQQVDEVKASQFRLTIKRSSKPASVKKFAVYDVTGK